MTVIKAAVLRSFGEPLVIEDLTLRSPQTSEVRVEIDAVAICHSDITFFDGGWVGTCPPSMAMRQPGASSRSAATCLTWRSVIASS